MSPEQLHAIFIEELIAVAPDLDAEAIGDNDHLQDDLELDSMDVLNLMVALQKKLGVSVPEKDLPQVATPRKAVDYFSRVLA